MAMYSLTKTKDNKMQVISKDYISCPLPSTIHIHNVIDWLNKTTEKYKYNFSGSVLNQFLQYASVTTCSSYYSKLFEFCVNTFGWEEDIDNYNYEK